MSRPFPQIRGRLTISSGPYRFTFEAQADRLVLRIGSWRTLMQLRKSVSRLLPQVGPLPIELTEFPSTVIALLRMPIARVIYKHGSFKIRLTPLKAFFSWV